ncbi:hypothetical protein [Ralstonia solanacearum]|uniref:hypothetical protein n=1 Tax=Ralstonia solanacearum TaxID=305 RepID=UPI001E3EA2C3|nr:hypothetical protein [Ralstonia solanacearum]
MEDPLLAEHPQAGTAAPGRGRLQVGIVVEHQAGAAGGRHARARVRCQHVGHAPCIVQNEANLLRAHLIGVAQPGNAIERDQSVRVRPQTVGTDSDGAQFAGRGRQPPVMQPKARDGPGGRAVDHRLQVEIVHAGGGQRRIGTHGGEQHGRIRRGRGLRTGPCGRHRSQHDAASRRYEAAATLAGAAHHSARAS